ncbi:MAG: hypothetical protein Q9184_005408, partial [Pyrenodesmia sp. 2 TL-2023]
MPASNFIKFVNARVYRDGYTSPPFTESTSDPQSTIYVDDDTGLIVDRPSSVVYDIKTVDLQNRILAPAFLELQTNGCVGVHFTQYASDEEYVENLGKPTPSRTTALYEESPLSEWKSAFHLRAKSACQVLPLLKPRSFEGGATLLGAHCEGPFLNPSKKGAHNASLMQKPSESSIDEIYGPTTSPIKLITLAPELPRSPNLLPYLTQSQNIRVSLGHSAATYETGLSALAAGASCLTHVFNAMEPLHHRSPGLAGLIALPSSHSNNPERKDQHESTTNPVAEPPYFSLIPDGIHLHPATLTLAFRSSPHKCILITDSVELAGLPDGLYPGNAQIAHPQRKVGNRVTIEGTDTLIG